MARKSYEQAKNFTLAFCSAFVVFSLLALGVGLVPLGSAPRGAAQADAAREAVPVEDFYRPREEDNLSVLLAATAEGGECRFVLAALDVQQGHITVRYLAPSTPVRWRGAQMTLEALYGRDGPLAAREALAEQGMLAGRWMAFEERTLAAAADMLGPVRFAPPGRVLDSGAVPKRGTAPAPFGKEVLRLDGAGLWELLFSPECTPAMAEAAVSAFLHAALALAPTPEGDNIFRAVVDLAQTDISYFDYDSRREALRFLAALLPAG